MIRSFTLLLINVIVMTVAIPSKARAQKYLDVKLSTQDRVKDIISKLTLNQKVKLLQFRGTAVTTNGLNIPAYNWWNECLHGVARSGKATVFPQAIGLAATWDTSFINNVADAISDEARAKYERYSRAGKRGIYEGLNFWTPNINIFRDPRWGRGMETYGEDPFLTGKMAVAFIKGLQGNNPNYFKTIATVKHFVAHSGPEEIRGRFNAEVSDRDFYETYTPAFKMAIQEGGVYSLMCAYNRFRGVPCCGNDFLLTDLLRNQWGFNGFIVTDCGAVNLFYKKDAHGVVSTPEEAAAMAIKAGVDLECGEVFNVLDKAIAQKLLSEKDLDVALTRLFTARFRLGFFDPPSMVPYSNIPYSVVENEAHRNLTLDAAKKSIVLLKNQDATLPLKKTVKTLAVIGPNADDQEVLLANYNGYPTHVVTPLEAITKKLPGTKVLYARGSGLVDGFPVIVPVPGSCLYQNAEGSIHGLNGQYFGNTIFESEPLMNRIDSIVNFNWIDRPPHSKLSSDNFSVKWAGFIKAPLTGATVLDLYGSSNYELIIDGKTLFKFDNQHGAEHQYAELNMIKDTFYSIEIRFASKGNSAQLKLSWQLPSLDLHTEALRIASQADAVIMCMGLSPRIEGEEMKIKLDGFTSGDRTSITLPKIQQNLIKEISALGKPVILVLINGGAVAVNWENQHVPAIIEAWYGGQQGGNAIADVLFGDYNPGGKLPVTFYASNNDIPDFENYNMAGRTYRYFKGKPLYPFGYGLSYTHFSYTAMSVKAISPINKAVVVTAMVKNTGNQAGDVVAQLYLKNLSTSAQVPISALKGFQRWHLKKGEQRKIIFMVPPDAFSQITANGKSVIAPGHYRVSIGGGQFLNGSKATGNDNVLCKTVQLNGKIIQLN